MSNQTCFEFDAPVRINTRLEAAASIERIRGRMLDRVLEFVTARGERGATDEEIADGVHLRESTARARRCELRDGGQVRESGRYRKTQSDRHAIVWTATGEPL